jgi:hypothetical protein
MPTFAKNSHLGLDADNVQANEREEEGHQSASLHSAALSQGELISSRMNQITLLNSRPSSFCSKRFSLVSSKQFLIKLFNASVFQSDIKKFIENHSNQTAFVDSIAF